MKILTVTNLRKKFKNKVVLANVNLTVSTGELVCITGANGSGKTILLDIITGLIKADYGKVKFWTNQSISKAIKREIGIVNVTSRLFTHLTPLENILFYNEIYQIKNNKTKIEHLFKYFNLEYLLSDKNTTMEKLSSGQNVKIHLIKTLIGNPKIIFLDEPTAYLDKVSKNQIINSILEYKKKQKVAFLIASHSQSIIKICDRKLTLKNGILT